MEDKSDEVVINYKTYKGFMGVSEPPKILQSDSGRYRTCSLFYETCSTEARSKGMTPLYTLKDRTFKGLPSVWLIYAASATEHEAMQKIVGQPRHWDRLVGCDWFLNSNHVIGPITAHNCLSRWRRYKEEADIALAKKLLLKKVSEGDINAAKHLLAEDRAFRVSEKAASAKQERIAPALKEQDDEEVAKDFKLLKLVKK